MQEWMTKEGLDVSDTSGCEHPPTRRFLIREVPLHSSRNLLPGNPGEKKTRGRSYVLLIDFRITQLQA